MIKKKAIKKYNYKKNTALILACGESKRFKIKSPKQYIEFFDDIILNHTIKIFLKNSAISHILLVLNKKHKKYFNKIIRDKKVLHTYGGNTRQKSVFYGLKFIKKFKPTNVLIHDAARPNFSLNLLDNLFSNLKYYKCVVPTIKINDSIKFINKNQIINLKRENIYLTQTPQAFHFKELYKLQKDQSSLITDDANLFISANKKVKFINGEINNSKITTKYDVVDKENLKYGIGFDVHRLVQNRKLYLGGIKIPSKLGALGYSDGDIVLHAVIDSILGACKMGDIGEKFSNKNKKYRNIRSNILLKNIIDQIKLKNYTINNIDINIITQKPKISKYKKRMIQSISKICETLPNQINIKGKTTEKLGLIGKEKAIACEVITSVIKYA